MPTPASSSPRLLIVDDDDDLRQALERRFRSQGLVVTAAAGGMEALAQAAHSQWDVALLDLSMPGMSGIELLERLKAIQPELEALLLTAQGSMETAIQAMKRGAYDYLTKPFHLSELEVHIHKAYEKVRLARRERQWVEQIIYESSRHRLVGSGPAMQKVIQLIQKVAPTDSTVLVRGASGTGKELVARALHTNSPRRDRPLVTINCAALQETLLESELFGHERGAFTGAVQAKAGLVEVAEGGTLFIDEIGEMVPGLQAKLLRVLEDGHYRRVGSTRESRADVRVVAATNDAADWPDPLPDPSRRPRSSDSLRVARQRSRAGERDRTGPDPGRRPPHHPRRPPGEPGRAAAGRSRHVRKPAPFARRRAPPHPGSAARGEGQQSPRGPGTRH
jgi:DNA-binding NtrC family response regulator